MAEYRISGIWKTINNVITHYAFHLVNENTVNRAEKVSKEEAVRRLEVQGNSAYTWVWNYNRSFWDIGEKVEVIKGANGKYLRSNKDKQETDNLAHLIDYDWIFQ